MRLKIKMKDYIMIIDNVNSICIDPVINGYVIGKNDSNHRIRKSEVEMIQIV